MAIKGHLTGMIGVYLVAAELSKLGFIVSPTSRSAAGADLLVTDQKCQKAWSVQVKTNRKAIDYWLVGERAYHIKSDSHVYVFVNLKGDNRPEYLAVHSDYVAAHVHKKQSKVAVWYSFWREDRPSVGEGWELFGDPHPGADATELQPEVDAPVLTG